MASSAVQYVPVRAKLTKGGLLDELPLSEIFRTQFPSFVIQFSQEVFAVPPLFVRDYFSEFKGNTKVEVILFDDNNDVLVKTKLVFNRNKSRVRIIFSPKDFLKGRCFKGDDIVFELLEGRTPLAMTLHLFPQLRDGELSQFTSVSTAKLLSEKALTTLIEDFDLTQPILPKEIANAMQNMNPFVVICHKAESNDYNFVHAWRLLIEEEMHRPSYWILVQLFDARLLDEDLGLLARKEPLEVHFGVNMMSIPPISLVGSSGKEYALAISYDLENAIRIYGFSHFARDNDVKSGDLVVLKFSPNEKQRLECIVVHPEGMNSTR